MKNLKFLLFPTDVPVTLLKSKLQIHPVNPTNPDILKFITKFLKIKGLQKSKILFFKITPLKCKECHPQMLDFMKCVW